MPKVEVTQLNIGQQLVGLKKRTGREGEQKKWDGTHRVQGRDEGFKCEL